jgi:AcrR family transcriptional regulator
MEEEYFSETLRDRLIIAGADEISRYGMTNFSLRRVAATCNVSCAAPYKHFKNKEDFILEIIRYINRQWELLCTQILTLFENDARRRLTEVCIAYVRFWVANPNYRSVLSMAEGESEDAEHTVSISRMIRKYCEDRGVGPEETERTDYALKAILYGMTAMIENGELENSAKSYDHLRATIEKELS